MRKKVYGIDLDGVCFDFTKSFSKWLRDRLGVKCNKENIKSYWWHECTDGLSEDDFWKEFHKFGKEGHGYMDLELMPGTLAALDTILAAGHKIIFITHRPDYAREDTRIALKNAGISGDIELVFTDKSKSLVIKKRNVDVIIDDSPNAIADVSTNTRATVYCRDHLYNRHLDDTLGWWKRVSDWAEFLVMEGLV